MLNVLYFVIAVAVLIGTLVFLGYDVKAYLDGRFRKHALIAVTIPLLIMIYLIGAHKFNEKQFARHKAQKEAYYDAMKKAQVSDPGYLECMKKERREWDDGTAYHLVGEKFESSFGVFICGSNFQNRYEEQKPLPEPFILPLFTEYYPDWVWKSYLMRLII